MIDLRENHLSRRGGGRSRGRRSEVGGERRSEEKREVPEEEEG